MDGRFLAGLITGVTAAIIGMGIVIVGILGIFFFAIIGALIGAITGFILQSVPILGNMVLNSFHQIGIQNANLAERGAMLGFIAGFFKPVFERRQY